jgi:4-aminobutyrate aminotransferase-like enzyme/Ser/Thr protein kinase RdoA (MazF antagonist)
MTLLDSAPRLSAADAVRIARESFGLDATAQPLPSERDQNFALETGSGRFVLKIANQAESREQLEAENGAMAHAASRGGACPRVIAALDGCEIAARDDHFVRLLTWIQGVPLAAVRHQSPALLEHLGWQVGIIDRALGDFDHPAAHREFRWDLARADSIIGQYMSLIEDRAWADSMSVGTSAAFMRLRPSELRCSVVHNDANDYNVIVNTADITSNDQRVTGLIDFGDLVHSFTVADLAVALAYVVLDKPDPVAAASHVVRGYHAENPLTEEEFAALWDLVRVRVFLSACIAADQQRQRPDDPYLAVSQAPIRRTLPRLMSIHHRFAEAAFRHACGLSANPRADHLVAWLRQEGRAGLKPDVIHGCDSAWMIDLSVGSPLVSGDPSENAEPRLTARIGAAIQTAGARVGVGRYLEPRSLYSSAAFAGATEGSEPRTIHLGIDLFAPAGTAVRAPLDGVVHAVADRQMPMDYGPVIVLRHGDDERPLFYTLYGHLSRESIEGLDPGHPVAAGQAFATLGSAEVNGGWTPHLHLQFIAEPLDMWTGYPGVCRASEQAIWSTLSPDPSVLLSLPEASVERSTADDTLSVRRRHIGRNLSIGYSRHVKVLRGWMQYLFDAAGRRYLDGYNNVPHVGHAHPRIVAAAAEQARTLSTNTRYLHDALGRFAERLVATMPSPLSVCYFVSSGSEANELALRLARASTHDQNVIVLDAAYHGNTTTLIDISPYKFNGPGGEGKKPWVHVAPIPDTFRGQYKREDRGAGARFADSVAEIIHGLKKQGSGRATFIAETCPSVGGQMVFPPEYLRSVYAHMREAGGICIADEVQTAYGRMGTSFYAFEDQGVVPDIVVLGKPIGNGYPLGAVVTTVPIAAAFDNGMEFFSTFGGSTVSCAVGLAVLDEVLEQDLQGHAARVGAHWFTRLHALAEDYSIVGDVRGSGLFAGIELIKDRDTLAPAAAEAGYIVNRMREEGILIGTDGPLHNVLKIRPPMPFDEADADLVVSSLRRILHDLAG